MFRLAVDGCDVRENSIEPDGSLWKLLPTYGKKQKAIEWIRREKIGDTLWSHWVTIVTPAATHTTNPYRLCNL